MPTSKTSPSSARKRWSRRASSGEWSINAMRARGESGGGRALGAVFLHTLDCFRSQFHQKARMNYVHAIRGHGRVAAGVSLWWRRCCGGSCHWIAWGRHGAYFAALGDRMQAAVDSARPPGRSALVRALVDRFLDGGPSIRVRLEFCLGLFLQSVITQPCFRNSAHEQFRDTRPQLFNVGHVLSNSGGFDQLG